MSRTWGQFSRWAVLQTGWKENSRNIRKVRKPTPGSQSCELPLKTEFFPLWKLTLACYSCILSVLRFWFSPCSCLIQSDSHGILWEKWEIICHKNSCGVHAAQIEICSVWAELHKSCHFWDTGTLQRDSREYWPVDYITFIPHIPGLETQMEDRWNLALEGSERELSLTFCLVQQMSVEERDDNSVTWALGPPAGPHKGCGDECRELDDALQPEHLCLNWFPHGNLPELFFSRLSSWENSLQCLIMLT